MAEVTGASSTPDGIAAVPRPAFRLIYGQKNITNDLMPYVISVTYSDYLTGQSDEIEVELEDTDGRWIGSWYPGKGDALTLKVGYDNEPLLACGTFEIDEVEFSDSPSTVSIRGLGSWPGKPVRTRNSMGFEKTTLAAIAQHVAKRNGFTLTGKIRHIPIDRATQYGENDVAFLSKLADEYGYAFKVSGKRLVFTEVAALLASDPAKYFVPQDLTNIRITDKINFVYKDAEVKHHDPKKKSLVVVGVKADGQIGEVGKSTSSDTLKTTARASDKATAQIKGESKLKKANLEQTTGTITVPGSPSLVAGLMIGIDGFGRLDGKYLVQSARHRLDRSSGYTTELEIAREMPVPRGQTVKSASSAKKKSAAPGKLQVYGIQSDGQVGAVGTTNSKR
ncbi:MAG: contractile injection system protein, VgrG/Pvc8 family [Proteobacteria bacterium]|nr:contractile injection system protein, VgrG/Pvc8 family [Pseudomonadota bacterium]